MNTIAAWRAGITLLRDPSRLDMVFALDRALPRDDVMLAFVEAARGHERGRAALAERPRLHVDLPALRAKAEGTLGRVFADFLDANGLDPKSIPTLDAPDETTWIQAHLYETHDVWHVATGFATDIPGEVGLQAFYAAQFPMGRLPRLLLTGGLLHSIFKDQNDYANRLDAVARGYALGKRAEPLLGVRWDQLWDEPLADVRARLGLTV